MRRLDRRTVVTGAAGGLLAAPGVARALTPLRWRMATSWPKNLPGPGRSAQRIAERIQTFTQGRIEVLVFGAGEIVPAFAVQDAVGAGTIELGHTAAFFGTGREPALHFFTTVPFGLLPGEHMTWLRHGGGQALWDATQATFGVKPFVGGNTGVSMGGWFRREIAGAEDLRGLKIRMVGLGAELFQRLGATALAIPPGDIYPALERGAIDAAEFTAPGSDIQFSLWRSAPNYYAPGFNKPNGASELLVHRALWERLDDALKAAVEEACFAEAGVALAEIDALNVEALQVMTTRHGVRLRLFPQALIAAARREAEGLMQDLAGRSPAARNVTESYGAFQRRTRTWTALSLQASLAARGG